jgi:uncharacterized membrane protein
MYCRNCGKEVQENVELCPSCGVKPASGQGFCPACGGQTNELTEVCVKCGTRLHAAPVTQTDNTLSSAPPPGVKSPYNWAWKTLWPVFWMLLLILIIYGAISGAASSIPVLGSVFVSVPLAYGSAYVFLKAARHEKINIEDVFQGFKTYWNTIGAWILAYLIVLAGLILLVVPGIIFACKLAFVPYLVVDRKMGPTEAIQESWRMSRGHAMEVFGIYLLALLLSIAGLICLVVGVIVAAMWIELTIASLYYAVSAQQKKEGNLKAVS